jgi:HEAT repeat protein
MNRTPPDRSDGYLPVFALGFLGQAAEPAVPVMVEALTNKNDNIHLEAAHRLGQLRLRPDLIVPALASFLESQRNQNGNATRCAPIQSLLHYGTNASMAAPVVVSMLTDPDANVRQHATNCLPHIDRAAAVRANVPIPWGL